jgi:hypothetical protein
VQQKLKLHLQRSGMIDEQPRLKLIWKAAVKGVFFRNDLEGVNPRSLTVGLNVLASFHITTAS